MRWRDTRGRRRETDPLPARSAQPASQLLVGVRHRGVGRPHHRRTEVRPMTRVRRGWSETATHIENRILDRLRSRHAYDVASQPPSGAIESFRSRKYCLLVTYRADGTPVPSPV